MNRQSLLHFVAAMACSWLAMANPAHAAQSSCDAAWTAYNDFKARNWMEESQYTLTIQGADVRAACGEQALPAPRGADVPGRSHVPPKRHHRPHKPKPPGKPAAPAAK